MLFDLLQLKQRCLSPIPAFAGIGESVWTPNGLYIHRNQGAHILAVAHLDTVESTRHFYAARINGQSRVYNPQLDDRLGVYVILDLLPGLLGINAPYDILLTTGEESGRSSARYFTPQRAYHWIFSFDRGGQDVVLYQYDSPENRARLAAHGFAVGHGSYSDIAALDHLEISGFNFGVGYYDYHSPRAYAVLEHTARNIRRFTSFYHAYKDTPIPAPAYPDLYRWQDTDSSLESCWYCGTEGVPVNEDGLCELCVRYRSF